MGSRLVAAALAVALLGCGGSEKKGGAGGGDAGGEVVHTDRLDARDCEVAAQDFARKVSEHRAAGALSAQVVQVKRAPNDVGSSFDVRVFQRAVEEELARAGLEVLADPRSEAGRQADEAREYEDATGGESEAAALEKQKRADGLITLLATKDRVDRTLRFTLSCRLMDRGGTLLVTSVTTITKTQE